MGKNVIIPESARKPDRYHLPCLPKETIERYYDARIIQSAFEYTDAFVISYMLLHF